MVRPHLAALGGSPVVWYVAEVTPMKQRFLSSCSLALLLSLVPMSWAETVLPPPGEDPSRELERLAAMSGLVLPSVSLPLSRSSLAAGFALVAAHAEGGAALAGAEAWSRRFAQEDVPAVEASLSLQYEQYLRPAEGVFSTADFAELVEVVDPLGVVRLGYQLDNATVLGVAVAVRREYNRPPIDSNFFPSVPGNPVAIENNNLTEGFLQSRLGPLELTFGRQKIHIGPSPVNSLLLSQRLPFMDALDLKGYFGPLTMTLVVSTLENREASPDVAPGSTEYDFASTVILCNTHYFEYSFGAVRVGIGGQYLAVRPQNAFQITDFFPVISWHQTNIVPNNLSLVADVSVSPLRGLTVYAQAGVDDINLSGAGVNDSGVPTIPAFLLGAAWQGGARDFPLSAWVETGYTHYLWGSFDDGAAMARAIYRMDIDGVRRWIPLTSPYGPGTIWAAGSVSLATPWHADAGLRIRYLARNPRADLTGPYEADTTVASAHLSKWLQAALELRWTPVDQVRVFAAPEFNLRDGTTWFALTLGGGISLRSRSPLRPAGV
jgi:hypothetical protein